MMNAALFAGFRAAPAAGAEIEFVVADGFTTLSFGDYNFTLPSGISDGDTIWLYLGGTGTDGYDTPPAGWSLVAAGGTDARLLTGASQAVYVRVRQSGDPDTILITDGGAGLGKGAACIVTRNASGATDVAIAGSTFDTNPGALVVDVDADGALLMFTNITIDGATWTAPSGMTKPAGIESNVDFSSVSGAYELGLSAGTPSRTGDWNTGNGTGAVLIAIA